MMSAHKITRIDILDASLALRKTIRLGAQSISRRDYVAVRLTLADGAQGFAYGYGRGLPLFDIVQTASQAYIGEDARLRNRLRLFATGLTPAPRAAMIRGASLLDIALWDAWCRSLGQPLWAVLGGARSKLPVMPVVGYGMSPEAAGDETAALTSQGFSTIKLMIDGRNIQNDQAVMEGIASALPTGCSFGIDAHWSWSTVDEALPYCRLAERLGAVFVEDPFAPTHVRAIAELAAKLDIPLAVGEDVVDVSGFRDLCEAGGILRVDASVSGGISGAIEAVALAKAHNRAVIPHVFSALHAHIGHAFETVRCVEKITLAGADPIAEFELEAPAIQSGLIEASTAPGASAALDWARLAPLASRQMSIEK